MDTLTVLEIVLGVLAGVALIIFIARRS